MSATRRARTKAQVEQEFAEFKERVKEVAMNWPSGCDSGKREFLQEIGVIEKAEVWGTYVFTVSLDLDDEQIEDIAQDRGYDPPTTRQEVAEMLKVQFSAQFEFGNYDGDIEAVEFSE